MFYIPALLLGVPGWIQLSHGLTSPPANTSFPIDVGQSLIGALLLLGSAIFIIIAAVVHDEKM